MPMNERLYRSVDDRVIAGVCGGLADRMQVDPSLVRIGYAIVALLTGIVPLVIVYVVMAVVVPEEPTGFAGVGGSPPPPGPDSVPGWSPPSAGPSAAPPAWTTAGAQGADGSSETMSAGTPAGAPAPAPPGPAPAWAADPAWSRAQRRAERRERRRNDPLPAIIGGLVLVALGVYFLVRDRVDVDWGLVWAGGLVALGVVIVVAAFVRPRR
jgi:phage shock protein PspC (stress-responsive transcriptional regulator)